MCTSHTLTVLVIQLNVYKYIGYVGTVCTYICNIPTCRLVDRYLEKKYLYYLSLMNSTCVVTIILQLCITTAHEWAAVKLIKKSKT